METTNGMNQQENEIDLLELLDVIRGKIVYVIAVAALLGGLVALYNMFFVTPMYQADSTLYVMTRTGENLTTSDVSISNALLNDYQYLATSRLVVNQVLSELDIAEEYSYERLSREISISVPDSSRMLIITIMDADPIRAKQIADKVAEVMVKCIGERMETEASIIDTALTPKEPTSPNIMRNTILGVLVGIVIAVVVIVVRFMLDDTIKNEGDVERVLQLPVLALIPVAEGDASLKERKKQAKAEMRRKARGR